MTLSETATATSLPISTIVCRAWDSNLGITLWADLTPPTRRTPAIIRETGIEDSHSQTTVNDTLSIAN